MDRQHPDKLIKKPDRRSSGRRGARRNTRAACRAGKLGMGRNIAVEVLDVSETGVRLRVKEECADNAEVQVQLGSPGLPRSVTVTGKVVWCIRTEQGDYCVGVRLSRPLPYRDFLTL